MHKHKAFTIVELLIVIVVIGILASITIVSFAGITRQTGIATIQSDLSSNGRKIQLYFTQYGSYPTALDANNCPSAQVVDSNYCIKLTSGNIVSSYNGTQSTYILIIIRGNIAYRITDSTGPTYVIEPAAPTIASLSPGVGQISVVFTAGSEGGSPITNYEYSTNGGSTWTTRTPANTSSPLIITGLSENVSYNVRIRAINANGVGAQSNQLTATTQTTSPTIISNYSTYDLLFCRFASNCSGVSGITADFSYQVAFTAKAGSKYSVNMVQIDNTSTNWTSGTTITSNISYATPTAGASLSSNIITTTNAGETRVTFTGTGLQDKTLIARITEVDNSNNAISQPTHTKALGVYTTVGSYTLTVPATATVTYMIVAGGGGSGIQSNGGEYVSSGGAGGLVSSTSASLTSGSKSIVVGAGGARGANGADSSLTGFTTAVGGGKGAGTASGGVGGNGGSGGGGWGSGIPGQGYNGGALGGDGSNVAGGGGGAGGPEGTGPGPTSTPGVAGSGLALSITGTSVVYAKGGGAYDAQAASAYGGGGDGNQGWGLTGFVGQT